MSAFGTRAFDAVFDSQRVFRCVLQATSQPGKLFTLPPTDAAPPRPSCSRSWTTK